jgi:hypothetical protein
MNDRRPDSPERVQRLIEAVDVADQLRSLSQHPEVQRWFDVQDRMSFDQILSAEDETTRVEAIARAKALRDLRGHLMAVDQAANSAVRKLKTMKDQNG